MGNFVTLDGYREGMPKMEAKTSLLEEYGPIVVDYDGLEEMYHGDLSIPREKPPHVQFTKLRRRGIGVFNPFNGKTKIDLDKADVQPLGNTVDLIKTLLHEGQHNADYINNRLRFCKETARRLGPMVGAWGVGALVAVEAAPVDNFIAVSYGGLSGMLLADYLTKDYLYDTSPSEERARARETNGFLLSKYANVISFPELTHQEIVEDHPGMSLNLA